MSIIENTLDELVAIYKSYFKARTGAGLHNAFSPLDNSNIGITRLFNELVFTLESGRMVEEHLLTEFKASVQQRMAVYQAVQ